MCWAQAWLLARHECVACHLAPRDDPVESALPVLCEGDFSMPCDLGVVRTAGP